MTTAFLEGGAGRNRPRRSRCQSAITATFALSLLVISSAPVGTLAGHVSYGRPVGGLVINLSPGALNCSAILPDQVINNTLIGAGVPPANRSWDSRQIVMMFGEVCVNPEFVTLVNAWGAKNFTFEQFWVYNIPIFANFTMLWSNWTAGLEYSNQEYWAGCVTTGVVTGPFIQTNEARYSVSTPSESCPLPHSGSSQGATGFGGVLPNVVLPAAIMAGVAVAALFLARTQNNRRD